MHLVCYFPYYSLFVYCLECLALQYLLISSIYLATVYTCLCSFFWVALLPSLRSVHREFVTKWRRQIWRANVVRTLNEVFAMKSTQCISWERHIYKKLNSTLFSTYKWGSYVAASMVTHVKHTQSNYRNPLHMRQGLKWSISGYNELLIVL